MNKEKTGIYYVGQICYGIAFRRGAEFPWDEHGYDGDINEWWIHKVIGLQHTNELSDKTGLKQNQPMPVQLINYCNDDYPHWILAIPSSIVVSYEYQPTGFNPSNLRVLQEAEDELTKFCSEHGIDFDERPKWWLSSYRNF